MRSSQLLLTAAVLTIVSPASSRTKISSRPVLGAAQLPGDDGKRNLAYTMGKAEKLNIVVTGVRAALQSLMSSGSPETDPTPLPLANRP